jgi:hypothetical protein
MRTDVNRMQCELARVRLLPLPALQRRLPPDRPIHGTLHTARDYHVTTCPSWDSPTFEPTVAGDVDGWSVVSVDGAQPTIRVVFCNRRVRLLRYCLACGAPAMTGWSSAGGAARAGRSLRWMPARTAGP